MVKHSFKVGNTVKLKPRYVKLFPSVGAQTLTIVEGECGDRYIPVWHKGMKWTYFPLKPCEIEHAIKVGEQLLFNFMSEATK